MLVFYGVLFCVNLLCRVCFWFFPFVVLVVSFSEKSNCLVWVFCLSIFWYFMLSFFRHINILQKNKLSVL